MGPLRFGGKAFLAADFLGAGPIRSGSAFGVVSHRELGDETILQPEQQETIRNSL